MASAFGGPGSDAGPKSIHSSKDTENPIETVQAAGTDDNVSLT